jgi:hypothetical protein
MSVNHRLTAREHLAEAAALHGEGELGPAVCCLRIAAVEAVAALDEPGSPGRRHRRHRLVPALAAERLAGHGIPPGDARDLLADLHLDCAVQERGEDTEFTASHVEQAIASVQQLADLAVGLPTGVRARVTAAGPQFGPEVTSPRAPAPPEAVPERPGRWIADARRRRRRGRAIAVLVPVSTVLAVVGAGIAIAIVRPQRAPDHRFEVLSRTHDVSPRAAPRPDVPWSPRSATQR